MQLKDKVAVVTGGGRGLGRAYCEALAAEGALVVAADIRDTADTVATIEAAGGQAVGTHGQLPGHGGSGAGKIRPYRRGGQ
jgi:NAD(P)-dependent dehydrogenase (short-subunit alcohol dehydrogenase family)